MNTPDTEFYRVIRHETGHTLGFPHEHTRAEIVNRINRDKAIAYFMATQGWSRQDVIEQVLTPLDNSALIATAQADINSIMCYWLPAEIMNDGIAVNGGTDIDSQDAQFAASVYPNFTLWHTLRKSDGHWTGLGNVHSQIVVPGPVAAVCGAAGINGDAQFMFTTTDGHLWHTIRQSNGHWTGLGDVQEQFRIPNPVAAICGAASSNGEAQFMFTTNDGHLWHTIRQANGHWTGLGDVQTQIQVPGPVASVCAASGVNGEVQFMFATTDGRLWHTIRQSNGHWTGLGDVQGQFHIPGRVKAVCGAAGGNGDTQFMFTTEDGHLWHTIRQAKGHWTGLGDVQGQFPIPGAVSAVSATPSSNGEVQFMFTTRDGHLWHTIRQANGHWTGLGDVQGQFPVPRPIMTVGAAAGTPGETQFIFAWHFNS